MKIALVFLASLISARADVLYTFTDLSAETRLLPGPYVIDLAFTTPDHLTADTLISNFDYCFISGSDCVFPALFTTSKYDAPSGKNLVQLVLDVNTRIQFFESLLGADLVWMGPLPPQPRD